MPILLAFTDSVPYSSSSSGDAATNSSFVTTPTTTAAVAEDRWLELTIMCVKGIIFGTIIIGAVLGNALVIISVQRNRKLRVITNFFGKIRFRSYNKSIRPLFISHNNRMHVLLNHRGEHLGCIQAYGA